MELVPQIIQAIQAKAWYPAIGLIATLVVALWRVVQPTVWDKIPSQYKVIPALALTVLSSFVAAFASGETWQVAIFLALYALITSWPLSVGTADIYNRLSGRKG